MEQPQGRSRPPVFLSWQELRLGPRGRGPVADGGARSSEASEDETVARGGRGFDETGGVSAAETGEGRIHEVKAVTRPEPSTTVLMVVI